MSRVIHREINLLRMRLFHEPPLHHKAFQKYFQTSNIFLIFGNRSNPVRHEVCIAIYRA
jgi:hypothetical protein